MSLKALVVRKDGDIYRLLFAARAMDEASVARFDQAIQSFRPLTEEEAASVRPLKLQVVKAGLADNVDSLSRRMATVDRSLDVFLLLNGLSPGASLKYGETYKIVVDQ